MSHDVTIGIIYPLSSPLTFPRLYDCKILLEAFLSSSVVLQPCFRRFINKWKIHRCEFLLKLYSLLPWVPEVLLRPRLSLNRSERKTKGLKPFISLSLRFRDRGGRRRTSGTQGNSLVNLYQKYLQRLFPYSYRTKGSSIRLSNGEITSTIGFLVRFRSSAKSFSRDRSDFKNQWFSKTIVGKLTLK